MRLRRRLVALIGLTGYTTLFARAVRLAQAEVPAMQRVTFNAAAGGDLHGVREFALANDPGATAAGLSAILAHVIGLLITFIGEDLALRLVRESWPELAHGLHDAEGRL